MNFEVKPFREVLSFWNEAGAIVSLCVCIGYFGSRGWLGRLPTLLAIALCIGSLVLAYLFAKAERSESEDGWIEKGSGDRVFWRFVRFSLFFLGGLGVFMVLGWLI